jgi:hypothetical protein
MRDLAPKYCAETGLQHRVDRLRLSVIALGQTWITCGPCCRAQPGLRGSRIPETVIANEEDHGKHRMSSSDDDSNDEKDAYSIDEFCKRHSISRSTYYAMQEDGTGPVEGHAKNRVLITKESAAAWRQSILKPKASPAESDPDLTPAQLAKQKRRP